MADAISTPVMTIAIASSTVVNSMMFPPRLGVDSPVLTAGMRPRREPSKPRQAAHRPAQLTVATAIPAQVKTR